MEQAARLYSFLKFKVNPPEKEKNEKINRNLSKISIRVFLSFDRKFTICVEGKFKGKKRRARKEGQEKKGKKSGKNKKTARNKKKRNREEAKLRRKI
jgi:hypothetical protein